MADFSAATSRFAVLQPELLKPMQGLETLDSEAIIAARMAKLVEIWAANDPPSAAQYDVASLEFDPLRIQAENATWFELLVRDRVNQAMRAVTLAFAVGTDLDAIGSRYPGGMPRLPNETYDAVGDARYRKRIWLSPNPLSPHGPAESYQYWALNAIEGALRDVSTVKIRPRLEDDPIIVVTCMAQGADPRPTTAQLLEIRKYIQHEARQGMTDVVSVQAPKLANTEYKLQVTLYPGPDATEMAATLKANLEKLVDNQRWLGVDHTRLAIAGACSIAGVQNVEIISPAADVIVRADWLVQVKNYDPVAKAFTVSPVEIIGTAE